MQIPERSKKPRTRRQAVELSVTGQNLLQSHHLEFVGQTTILSEVNRGVYAQIIFRH
jgi:hypothetical protein